MRKSIISNLLGETDEDTLSKEEIKYIQEALKEVKKGKVKPIEQVAKELGIKLN